MLDLIYKLPKKYIMGCGLCHKTIEKGQPIIWAPGCPLYCESCMKRLGLWDRAIKFLEDNEKG